MTNVSSAEADALRCGYESGHFTKSHVITWADQQIAACDEPSNALIDPSLCRSINPGTVTTSLRRLGTNDAKLCLKLQFGFLGLAFQSERISLEHAIRAIYRLVHDIDCEDGVTDDQRNMLYHLDDGYDLAASGTHGTLAEIEREFSDFICPYTHQLKTQFPQLFAGDE